VECATGGGQFSSHKLGSSLKRAKIAEIYSGGDPVAILIDYSRADFEPVSIIVVIFQIIILVAGVGFEPTTFRL
jgi:hypothetical protein